VPLDPSGGGFTVNLVAIAAANKNGLIWLKNITSSTNTITVDANGSQTIDGAATFTMNTAQQSVLLVSDGGTNWRTFGAATGGGGGSFTDTLVLGHVASHNSDTPQRVSVFEFNPSVYGTPTLTFRATAALGNLTVTGHVVLRNITDSDNISDLSFTGSTNFSLQSDVLTIGAGAGEVDNSSKIYEVRIFVDSPSLIDDTIELGSVELRIET
jgi:hypothetical protein